MTSAVANANDFNLKSYLFYSVVFHALLTVAVVGASFLERRGDTWGGVGGKLGGTKVNLVTSAGIPMPMESVVKESKAIDPTKGLHKEEPPKPPEPKTDAEKIRKFEKEKPLPPSPKSRTLENKAPVHDNDVPYGKQGNPDVSSGYTQNPGASSGVASRTVTCTGESSTTSETTGDTVHQPAGLAITPPFIPGVVAPPDP